jgi:hypothetical protein
MNSSTVILGAMSLAAGTLLVWVPIRVVNRGWRDRQARLGIALLFALVGYPAMLGPCCWVSSRTGWGSRLVTAVYRPLKQQTEAIVLENGLMTSLEGPLNQACNWYSELGAAEGWHWTAGWDHFVENLSQADKVDNSPYVMTIDWQWCQSSIP